ncbi:unnamed protein product [Protopolystoma xenopodis]|uniref:Uncharacterized protein n=1 Tax=Protopolystoma xenopodis TaxID=117903 RepID=A0A3S5A565_9PLAT|nr:unnamed protein product [Protopolystoma xenopodis]
MVLRECQRIDPFHPNCYLLASSLCLGQLRLIEEGVEQACQAIQVAKSQKQKYLHARAHLLLGWGYSIMAWDCRVLERKRDLQMRAIFEYTT